MDAVRLALPPKADSKIYVSALRMKDYDPY